MPFAYEVGLNYCNMSDSNFTSAMHMGKECLSLIRLNSDSLSSYMKTLDNQGVSLT
jgi:hypothetical protein